MVKSQNMSINLEARKAFELYENKQLFLNLLKVTRNHAALCNKVQMVDALNDMINKFILEDLS